MPKIPAPIQEADPCASADAGIGTGFDLGCDFSLSANPARSQSWAYGYTVSSTLAPDAFRANTIADTRDPIGFWHVDAATAWPYVAWNNSSFARVDPTNSWALRPRQVAMEGARDGRVSVVRFVTPLDGTYQLDARFEGVHFRNATTDVHVQLDGAPLFDGAIDGYGGDPAFHSVGGQGPTASYTDQLTLRAGAVLLFAVGLGADGSNANDTTGLTAHLDRAP